ncbi:MAG: RNA polymerase sigma-54 factor, partial [Candidatus Kapaibacteriota bacterium]
MNLQASLLQTLTPQQIQYLKLLQLPILQLEQHVRQEVEQNPMLDESSEESIAIEDESDFEPNENLLSTIPKDVMEGNDYDDSSRD